MYTCTYTYTHFSLFPTDTGVLHKVPVGKLLCTAPRGIIRPLNKRRFVKPLLKRSLAKHLQRGIFANHLYIRGFAKPIRASYTHMHILVFFYRHRDASQNPCREGALYTHIYTPMHILLFFSYRYRFTSQNPYRDKTLPTTLRHHEDHIEKELCKAPRDCAWALQSPYRQWILKALGGIMKPM